jgi:hypothetical protein
MVRDPQSRQVPAHALFVLTLGYSRKSVRLLVFHSSTQIWAELHEKAFRRLGGTTRIVVLDNLREGVLKPDIYDPTLNPLYRDVLAHYGAVAMPCRVGIRTGKGRWKAGRGHAQKTPLEGSALREPRGGAGVPRSLGRTLGRHAHSRHHQTAGRGHVRRREAGTAAAAGRAVSLLPVRRTHRASGRLRGSRSGLLQRAAGMDRQKRAGAVGLPHVRLLDPQTGQLLREHLRQARGGRRIKDEDRPQRRRSAHSNCCAAPTKPDRRSARSAAACTRYRERLRCAAFRACLSLAKKYGVARVDDACAAALEVGVRDYRFVRRYLERNPQPPLSLRQVDPLIRQLTLYRDFIDNKTNQESKE